MINPMPDHEQMVNNILEQWNLSSNEEVWLGREWYTLAHEYLQAVADSQSHKVGVECVANIVAVLSPGVSWDRNLLEADHILDGANVDDESFTAFKANVAKAQWVLEGDFTQVKGPKVEPFARLLANPTADEVVIDRHAIRVALGNTPRNRGAYCTRARVLRFQAAYRDAAEILGEVPSHVQAVVWLSIKRGEE